jgi:glutathione S-transferase
MSLTLHYHPLASFCWKVLIGLYENAAPFTPLIVDLGDEGERAKFTAIWPPGQFPVLQDDARGEVVAETTIIMDYLDLHYPGPVRFTPADPDEAWRVRLWDRLFDLHVQEPMQKIVGDRIRPAGQGDAHGVASARSKLATSYVFLEGRIGDRKWLSGGDFGLAECAAFPALYYGDKVQPLGAEHPKLRAYLARLTERPSIQRVLDEAGPYFHMFPAG